MPPYNFFDRLSPIYTRPRFLPASKVNAATIRRAIVGDGCIISDAHIERAVIGIRSIIESGATIRNSVIMGADYYEDEAIEIFQDAGPRPPIGIGRNSVIDRAIIDKNARIGESVVITPDGKAPNVDSYELLYTRRCGGDPEECGDSGRNLDLSSAMTMDPQFFNADFWPPPGLPNSLFSRRPCKSLRNCRNPRKNSHRAGGLVRSLSALAEMVRSRIRRHAVIGSGTRRTELAGRSCLCDPAELEVWVSPMKFCSKPAKNFRTAEPFNSTLPATPRSSATWMKPVSAWAGPFNSIRNLLRWRKRIPISSRSGKETGVLERWSVVVLGVLEHWSLGVAGVPKKVGMRRRTPAPGS